MFDAFVVLYCGLMMYFGFRYGTFRRMIHIGAFFLGLLLAQALSIGFAQLLNLNTGSSPVSSHYLVYMAIVFGLVIISEILGFAYASALVFLTALLFDRFVGMVLGLVAGVMEMTVVLLLFSAMFSTQGPSGTSRLAFINFTNDQINISILRPQLEKLEGVVRFVYGPVLPSSPESYFTKSYS